MQLFSLHYLKNSDLVYKTKYHYKFKKRFNCLSSNLYERKSKKGNTAQFHQNPEELTVGKLPLCGKSYIHSHKTLQVHLQQNGNIIPKICLFQSFCILRMLVIANFFNTKVMLMKCQDGSFKCKSGDLEIKSTQSNINCHTAQDPKLWITLYSHRYARLYLH